MPSAIGLRFYKLTAHLKHQRGDDPCDPSDLTAPVHDFLEAFVDAHVDAFDDSESERSWYFERKPTSGDNSIRGYINYGTFGFESTFRSAKTKKTKYNRLVEDVEEIPLFFEFWQPSGENQHICAFQSFQGRSCVALITQALQEAFEKQNPDHILRFKKLVAIDSPNSLYKDADVKSMKFIRSHVFSDRFAAWSKSGEVRAVHFEMNVKAQKGAILGRLGDIRGDFEPNDDGIVVIEGQEFEEAVATVMVGGRYRPVGIFGPTTDTGAIDVTENVVKGPNGHPTFDSIAEQSDELMLDLHKRLGEEV